MGDHFVLLVDRLLTESTLEAAIESRNRLLQATSSLDGDSELEKPSKTFEFGDIPTSRKLVECRICQDEDLDSNMEAPCSCSGSLKSRMGSDCYCSANAHSVQWHLSGLGMGNGQYAHRRCVQMWCNEKGNTVCEICHQQFKPNYTAPPPLFQIGRIPLNFRGNWETSGRDLQGARVIAMVSTDRAFLNPSDDEHSSSPTRSAISCHLIALVFIVLLILRHALPMILGGTKDISFSLILLLLLRTAAIILPIFVMVRAVTALQRRRRRQEALSSSDEESENPNRPAQLHVISVD